MVVISDDKIILRAPELSDVDSLYLLENDPRTWLDGAILAPLSRQQLWDYISSYDGDIFAASQLRLVIADKSSGELLGVIDLYDYDKVARRAYVGIIIKEQYRNSGYAARALSLIAGYCRQRLDMRMLAAVVRVGNKASERLFRSAGFIETGLFRSWLRTADGWTDAYHFQLLF